MELKLGDNTPKSKPPISRLIVHNQQGKPLFILEYDPVDKQIKFKLVDIDEITNQLIQTKSQLTTEKGVEAFGSFVAGAENNLPIYRHLLSLYLPKEDSTFDKYHITLEDTIQQLGLQNSLLLGAECYTVLVDPLQEFLDDNTITVEKYPLLLQFFFRSYTFEPFTSLMQGINFDGEKLVESNITDQLRQLQGMLEQKQEVIEAVNIYIMTISGAIMAQQKLISGNVNLDKITLEHISTAATITSPGILTSNGQSTLWFPFTKNRVGKISRAISTTLNTLSYASAKKDMQEQVQTNIAHKSHELIDIVAEHLKNEVPSQGLQTNVGYLVCSIRVKEEFENDMSTVLKVSQKVSDEVKKYGQTILAKVAKDKQFNSIKE